MNRAAASIFDEIRIALARIDENTKQSAVRSKMIYTIEDVAFLTGFSTRTVYGWIRQGRPYLTKDGTQTAYLKVASGLAERAFRVTPDELQHFLSHFPDARG